MNSSEARLYSKRRGFQKDSVKYFMPDLGIKESDKVLDIACGTGDLIYEIGTRAYSAIGIDISKDMIDVARQKYQRANVTYEVGDAKNIVENFPKWKGTFDKVVSVHVLHWIEDKVSAMRNIYDCLKIGGECFLLFCGPTHQMLGQNPDELPYYLKHHNKRKKHLEGYVHRMYNQLDLDDTQTLLESVGFEVLSGTSHSPCENIDISSQDELNEYLRTLLGHLVYLPRQYHTECLQDASDWCYKNFPVNQLGNIYNKITVIVVRAIKKSGKK